jgi:hypothetical protein
MARGVRRGCVKTEIRCITFSSATAIGQNPETCLPSQFAILGTGSRISAPVRDFGKTDSLQEQAKN